MFKDLYMAYLGTELKALLPSGYKLSMVTEVSYDAKKDEDEQTIICIVRFGVGSKKTDDPSSFNQPIILTVMTETNSVEVSQALFHSFFLTHSKAIHTLSDSDDTYFVMPLYYSPTVSSAFNQVNGCKRGLLQMMGVLSYSENDILGVSWLLNDTEVYAISPSASLNSSYTTPHKEGDNTGLANVEGSNLSYSFTAVLKNNAVLLSLLDIAYTGITASYPNNNYELKVAYGDIVSYTIPVKVTQAQVLYNNETGETTLTVTAVKREAVVAA
jgi:hypothetical protein